MNEFSAGKFTLEMSPPAPMWISIRSSDHPHIELRGFSHRDLADLKHVIERAMAEAERRCPGEVA